MPASKSVCLAVSLASLGCNAAVAPPLTERIPADATIGSHRPDSTSVSAPTAPSAATAAAFPGKDTLVLASWNLEWLSSTDRGGTVARSPADFARLRKYAERLNADVIAVQEVQSEAALARVFNSERYAFHVAQDGSAQHTGFVYDRRLTVQHLPDYTALNIGDLRSGAELLVSWSGRPVRLLSVHLKSGCFDEPLGNGAECLKLASQIPALERWIDARGEEGVLFAVLGDFNRRLFASTLEPVWMDLDDGEPAESDLFSPTNGAHVQCWKRPNSEFIDHLVLSRTLSRAFVPNSFRELIYDVTDQRHRRTLSDHCPISLVLSRSSLDTPPPASPGPSAMAPATSTALVTSTAPAVKGNVSRSGTRYYHTPDCPHYSQVKVDKGKGERSFDDEAAARAAGFARSPDCPQR